MKHSDFFLQNIATCGTFEYQQEFIPVGCVPSAAVGVSGVASAQRGVCQGGVHPSLPDLETDTPPPDPEADTPRTQRETPYLLGTE